VIFINEIFTFRARIVSGSSIDSLPHFVIVQGLLYNMPLMNEAYRFPRWYDTSSTCSDLLLSSGLCEATGVRYILKNATVIALNELCVLPFAKHVYLLREYLHLDDGGFISELSTERFLTH
jgi:hypothetical protein